MQEHSFYNKTEYINILKTKSFNPSQFELFKHLFLDFFILLGILISLRIEHWASYAIAQLLIPVLMFRSFALMHDAVHFTVSKKSTLNNLVGYIAGAFCLLPFYPWKKGHLEHHYWAGNIEKDPVMKIVKDYPKNSKTKNVFLQFAWKSWVPVLALFQHIVFWGIGLRVLASKKERKLATFIPWLNSYLVPAFVYVALYKAGVITPANVLPGLFLYLVMVEVINFPHHLELPQYEGEHKLKVWDQFLISRSCHYPKWFSHYILNNFNLHAEHHLFPQAPWYMLNELKQAIMPKLGDRYNYCLNNEWVMKARKRELGKVLIADPIEHGYKLSHKKVA